MNDEPCWQSSDVTLYHGDARIIWRDLEPASVHAIVTSPPYYGLRDYGVDGQLGLEATPGEYVKSLADLLTAWGKHVLRADGSLWLNLGDTYSGGGRTTYDTDDRLMARGHTSRPAAEWPGKCLLMIPERVALALIERGWILRNKPVWNKTNAMPTSAQDRMTTSYEHWYFFTRSQRYWYDREAVKEESGANWRDVWSIPTVPNPHAHFALMPPELVRKPILATVPEGGIVADPFAGAGTTAVMARRLGRQSLLTELKAAYCDLIKRRLAQDVLAL